MELKLAGYINMLSCTVDPSEYDIKEILDVLSVPEMKEILKELPKDNTSCTCRHELASTLLSSYHNGTCASLPKRILKWTGTCIRISKMADELLWRIQRLFFLNGDQDLSSFLLVEFGVVKFPDYACSISHHIFQERSDLLEYEDAIRVAQVMDESLDNNNMDLVTRCIDISENRLCTMPKQENATPPEHLSSFFSRFSASWVYSKILILGVSVYERDLRSLLIHSRSLSPVRSGSRQPMSATPASAAPPVHPIHSRTCLNHSAAVPPIKKATAGPSRSFTLRLRRSHTRRLPPPPPGHPRRRHRRGCTPRCPAPSTPRPGSGSARRPSLVADLLGAPPLPLTQPQLRSVDGLAAGWAACQPPPPVRDEGGGPARRGQEQEDGARGGGQADPPGAGPPVPAHALHRLRHRAALLLRRHGVLPRRGPPLAPPPHAQTPLPSPVSKVIQSLLPP